MQAALAKAKAKLRLDRFLHREVVQPQTHPKLVSKTKTHLKTKPNSQHSAEAPETVAVVEMDKLLGVP
jgi:uncharacterized OB-fold protein